VKPRSAASFVLPLPVDKPVLLDFEGGDLSSDAGFVPLALADQQLRLVERLAAAMGTAGTRARSSTPC